MRTSLVAIVTALTGFILGWTLHSGKAHETVRYVVPPSKAPSTVAKTEAPFPDLPKPPLDTPHPSSDRDSSPALPSNSPPSLVGDLPALPPATTDGGPIAPLAPAKKLPIADLNADEALARRVVLGVGGEIVSSADAQDSSARLDVRWWRKSLPAVSFDSERPCGLRSALAPSRATVERWEARAPR